MIAALDPGPAARPYARAARSLDAGLPVQGAHRGRQVQGLKEADSPKTLRANLRRDGVFLTEVLGEAQAKAQAKRDVNVRRWVLGRVGPRDLAVATWQLAVLTHAGVPLVEALTALVDQVEHDRLKRVLGDVKQRVNEGSSLADALAAHPRVFSTLYVNMIRAGETSGALEIVLVRLADFTESQARLRSKIAGTMAYPIAMMVIGTLIMGILFTVVIPKITQIFENTSATLPWYTALTIGISSFAARWWWAILLVLAAAAYGFARWRDAGRARRMGSRGAARPDPGPDRPADRDRPVRADALDPPQERRPAPHRDGHREEHPREHAARRWSIRPATRSARASPSPPR